MSQLTELTCPNCGSPVARHNPTSQTIVCGTCNSHLRVGVGVPSLLSQGARLSKPPKPIKLGEIGIFHDVNCFVLGRVDYVGWDNEDRWHWTEWLLGAEDGRMFWLSYDDEAGFVIFHKIRIRHAFDTALGHYIPIDKEGHKAVVKERYPAEITGVEGELTWVAKKGDRQQMVEAAGHGKEYSLQISASELELYEGVKLDETFVANAFNNQRWLKKANRRARNQQMMTTIGMAALVFGVIGLLMGAYFWNSGTKVATETAHLDATNTILTIPLNIETARRPTMVKIDMESEIPVNTWVEVDVSVVDPEDFELYIFTEEFWYETGSDEDGPWSEKDYSGSGKFVPQETGDYEIEIELGEAHASVSAITVKVEVYKNHVLGTWFLGYGGVAAILGLGLLAIAFPKTSGNFLAAVFEDDD